MPEKPADTECGGTRLEPDSTAPARFTDNELRRIYRGMVAAELRKGPLPYRNRRKLMIFAAQIGIKTFEASMIIAEAEREAGHLDDPELLQPEDLSALIHPERWPIWFKLTAALIVAMLVDLVAIRAIGW